LVLTRSASGEKLFVPLLEEDLEVRFGHRRMVSSDVAVLGQSLGGAGHRAEDEG
jgi:hypothetical protein